MIGRPSATLLLLTAAQGLSAPRAAGLAPLSERTERELWKLLETPSPNPSEAPEFALDALKDRGVAPRWRSAALQPAYAVSIEQLKTTTRCRGDLADAVGALGGQSVEKLAVLFFCVMLSAAASAVAAMQSLTFLPEIVRFTVVQLLCFAPYGYLSLGLALPEDLQRWVTRLYTALFPAYRARLRRHEAGHFVVGHALGLPVRSVQANAAAAAVEFYDGSAAEASALRLPEEAAARRPPRYGVSAEVLAVVSLAGIMAEIDEYADSEGGAADLAQLQQIFDVAGLAPEEVRATTRWAALQASLILKRQAPALEAVVAHLAASEAANEDPTAAGCVRAAEAAREGNAPAARRANRVDATLLERILVKPPRTDQENPVEYDRSEDFVVPWGPEDVPTLAGGVTLCFLYYVVANGGNF